MTECPVILVGSPHNADSVGDGAANGGVKSQALWVKLLQQHGYEAYFVTYDGSQIQWLIEHPPVISIAEARDIIANKPTRIMSTWLWSQALFDIAQHWYLYDEELSMTFTYQHQRGLLEQHLQQNRIVKIGTHTRTMQAYYNATYGILPTLIPLWGADYWQPDASKRVPNRIGYMDEGAHTQHVITLIAAELQAHGIDAEFVQIGGCESECLDKMQRCDLFLGLNQGKSDLWGEGCPLAALESMLAGCVVVAFDVIGNGEYLHDPGTGALAPRYRADMMAGRVIEYLSDVTLKEQTRERSLSFVNGEHRAEAQWRAVADFLDLEQA